jgi:hypothetical protein
MDQKSVSTSDNLWKQVCREKLASFPVSFHSKKNLSETNWIGTKHPFVLKKLLPPLFAPKPITFWFDFGNEQLKDWRIIFAESWSDSCSRWQANNKEMDVSHFRLWHPPWFAWSIKSGGWIVSSESQYDKGWLKGSLVKEGGLLTLSNNKLGLIIPQTHSSQVFL